MSAVIKKLKKIFLAYKPNHIKFGLYFVYKINVLKSYTKAFILAIAMSICLSK